MRTVHPENEALAQEVARLRRLEVVAEPIHEENRALFERVKVLNEAEADESLPASPPAPSASRRSCLDALLEVVRGFLGRSR